MTRESSTRTSFEQAFADWSELARTSMGMAARLTRAYVSASATWWAESGKIFGEVAADAANRYGDIYRKAMQAFTDEMSADEDAAPRPSKPHRT